MRQTVRRVTAFCAAALLCLSSLGCAFGNIRIEPVKDPSGNKPAETVLPETDLPEP